MNRHTLSEIYQIWVFERPNQLAAAIAYYAMFALAPVIYIALTIAGIFIDNLALADQAVARLEGRWVPAGRRRLESQIGKLNREVNAHVSALNVHMIHT